MKVGCIYKISCSDSGKFIIGSTNNFNKRKTYYLSFLRRNKWNNPYLQSTFNKYGEDSIKFEILQDNIPLEILGDVESIWIGSSCGRTEDKKSGMNMRDGKRPRFSQETITKIFETYKTKDWPKRNPNIDRPIDELNSLGEVIKTWKNAREISEFYNLRLGSVQCNARRNKSRGKDIMSLHNHYFIQSKDFKYMN